MSSPRVSSARLDAALLHAREPIHLLGSDGRILFVNKAWEELTGVPSESALGLICTGNGPSSVVGRAGDLASLASSLAPPPEAIAGRPVGGRSILMRSDGERLLCRFEYRPLHDGDGRPNHLLCFLRGVDDVAEVPESEARRVHYELLEVRHRLQGRYGFESLIGRGPAHARLLEQIKAVAATTVSAVVHGEPGAGKRQAARAIHQNGPLRLQPLQMLDCSVLPPETLERGLFGNYQTLDDARTPTDGRPTRSLLVLNVDEMHRDLQARLAPRIGESVRVLATTRVDLDAARASETLRADLHYALTTFVLQVRPLRERLDELPLLAQHFLERANARGGRHREGFQADALKTFLAYDWPGNLQELARVVDSAHEIGDSDQIRGEDLPFGVKSGRAAAYIPPPPQLESLDQLLEQVERKLIEHALGRARKNKSRAAELLGISRPRLYRRIKELGIPDDAEADDSATVGA